jgi:ssDNA-binding Zn-finger/Zn-ribbon topoisomerase 1
MILTEHQQKILNAEICPYCGSRTIETTETAIYGRSYKNRKMICCKNFPDCDSYVSTWEDGTACGRLADVKLRGSKNIAHKSFDKIWKEGLKTRDELYEDLSIYLRLPPELTHIGMFQSFTCYKVKDWADKLYFKLKEKEYGIKLQNK